MKTTVCALASAALFALSACQDLTPQQEAGVGGAVIGGGLGLLTAKVLGADNDWVIAATLATAAAGALVAQNSRTGECAYANGDGTYRPGPCP